MKVHFSPYDYVVNPAPSVQRHIFSPSEPCWSISCKSGDWMGVSTLPSPLLTTAVITPCGNKVVYCGPQCRSHQLSSPVQRKPASLPQSRIVLGFTYQPLDQPSWPNADWPTLGLMHIPEVGWRVGRGNPQRPLDWSR